MTEAQFNLAMNRIRNKDKSALKEIYEEYISFIYNVCLSVVKQKEAAEDITSEFFIRLWERADQFREGSGHKGYLAAIARNMAIDYLRKQGREQFFEANEDTAKEEPVLTDTSPTPEEEVVSSLSVEDALNTLKPQYREIVTMKVLGDMTFKEIAETLNIPMGTVTWNYQDALKKLRRFGYE